ncbi:MAG: GSCFA domain-containing protein, partial [Verrucomicrobiia bacterium]
SIEYKSPFVADCFSKSTLRVAAQEVVQKYDGRFFYWPSFEIVRWLAPLFGPVFGVDDGASRHVSLEVFASVTDAFITRLAAPEVRDVKSNDATANSTID